MTTIENNLVVEIDYMLRTQSGELLDSSKEHGALAYIHGKKNIIPGLEAKLEGKKVGEALKVEVRPEDAYGLREESLVQLVDKAQFGEQAHEVKPGMQFQVEAANGKPLVMTVVELKKDKVLLDGNHPLAGETLHFDVEILSLRPATKEELAKGNLQKESDCCSSDGCC